MPDPAPAEGTLPFPDRRRPSRPSRPLVRRLTLLAILPAAVTAILLSLLLTREQMGEIQALAQANAEAAAGQVAAVAAGPLAREDRAQIQRMLSALTDRQDLASIRILGVSGEVIAEAEGPAAHDGAQRTRVANRVNAPGNGAREIGLVEVELSLASTERALRTRLLGSALLLAVALVAAYLFAWRFARRMAAPIDELVEAVEELGRGRRRVRVEITRGGEIGRLQRGFNAASEALAEARANLEARIEEATRELAVKNQRLEDASMARTRFLAAASHDLRQPLYALTLLSSALRTGESDPAKLARAEHIQECVSSLDSLFSELLDLSRLEAGAMQPRPTAFPLDGLFDEVSRTFRMVAQKAELRLVVRKTDAWVRTDRTMLARILNNLVSNALRYTQDGGVLVGARIARDGVRIDVWDTGSGIETADQARVFEEFFQAHATVGRGERGLGLGLATVQRLARLLGTEVSLRSRPGRGTVVSLVVPLANPALQRDVPAVVDTPIDVSGLRVLVIDDEVSILEGMRVLGESWGCTIRTAEDAGQALAQVREWGAPDIVISDLRLRQGRSGLDALRCLAAHFGAHSLDQAPFARLLITGETKAERLSEIAASRVPVLHKPVPPERLREAIIAAILAARAGRERGR